MIDSLTRLRTRLSTPWLANGMTVAAGVAVIVLVSALLLPPHLAGQLFAGVIPTTIGDGPAPLRRKPAELLMSAGWTILAITVTSFASLSPWTCAPVIAALGLVAGMVVAFGRRGVPLSVTILFAAIIVLGTPPTTIAQAAGLAAFASLGALAYVPWGIAAAYLTERWTRRLVLVDAMRSVEAFIRAKADLYDPDVPLPAATAKTIALQAAMAERYQNARETLFDPGRRRDRYAEALVILIDISETALAAHTDHRQMREARDDNGQPIAPHMARLIRRIADGFAETADALLLRQPLPHDFSMLAELEAWLDQHQPGENATIAEWRSAAETTARKLIHVVEDRQRLTELLEARAADAPIEPLDLRAFQRYPDYDLALLRRHLTWKSPIARHAVRLSVALTATYIGTQFLGISEHSNWVLLSVAVVLRPAYGMSRQRVFDRIIGNVIGCALAALLIHFAPLAFQYAAIFVALTLAQAYAPIKYVIAVTGGSMMVLVQQHMLLPAGDFVFLERIVDTIAGTAIALVVARAFPMWEAQSLPAARARIAAAMRGFMALGLTPNPPEQAYRLARREFVEALGALASLSQRIGTEPHKAGYDEDATMRLLASGLLLLAHVLSLRLFLTRSAEPLSRADAAAALEDLRARVDATLAGAPAPAAALPAARLPADLVRRMGKIAEEADFTGRLLEGPA